MQSLLGYEFDFSVKGYINLVVFISIVILISTIVYFMVENRSTDIMKKLVVILKLLNKSVSVYVYYSNGGLSSRF